MGQPYDLLGPPLVQSTMEKIDNTQHLGAIPKVLLTTKSMSSVERGSPRFAAGVASAAEGVHEREHTAHFC